MIWCSKLILNTLYMEYRYKTSLLESAHQDLSYLYVTLL